MLRPTNDYRDLQRAVLSLSDPDDILVSVVVPFYKGIDELARCLAGLSSQNYPSSSFEVIVTVDGTSLKEPLTLCNTLLGRRIAHKVVGIPRDGYRLATARNNGINAAAGDLIILLDFDIVTKSTFIQAHVKWHRVGTPIITFGLRHFRDLTKTTVEDVASGSVDLASLPSVKSISNRLRDTDARTNELGWIHDHPAPYNLGHGFNLGFRRAHAIKAGLFDEIFNGASNYEDIEFCYRMWSRVGCQIVHVPECGVFHQENEVVTHSERTAGMEVNRKKLYALVPELVEYRRAYKVGEWSENSLMAAPE
jgi:cellulose synthase/poly-beta-1,6-N-acetylglucosamine synthase-like glycosyltransferase